MNMEQRITISDIEKKEFSREKDGYARREVDCFLDAICDEMALMLDEMANLSNQLAAAQQQARQQVVAPVAKPAAPTAAADAEFREILEMAYRVKSETITAAQKQAEDIIANAQTEARAKLGNLEDEKNTLTAQVDELKLTAMDFREKLSAMLEQHQAVLDKTSELF
ncbi:MAG: DivIVA domain-containing protein [Clostridiales bacterium]|nr:DivIVA domain-containing protein [Clostridiales bacterium]